MELPDSLGKPGEAALHALSEGLRRALGDELVGIYLTGSAVISHVDPVSSDLDLFVVTRTRLTEPQIERLEALHRQLAREVPWGDRLDVEYGGLDQLRPTGIDGEAVFIVPGGELERGTSVSAADDVFGVREYGLPLVGPPAREVFPAVSPETYVASRRDYLHDLIRRGERRPDATDRDVAVWSLELARCLFGLESGALCSKPQAAEWLAQREPSLREPLDDALAAARGDDGAAARARSGYAALAAYAETILTPAPPGGGGSKQRHGS